MPSRQFRSEMVFSFISLVFLSGLLDQYTSCEWTESSQTLFDLCYEYNPALFSIVKFKGRGSFGEVNLARFRAKPDSPIFALKKVLINSEQARNDVTREIKAGLCFRDEPLLLAVDSCFLKSLPNNRAEVYIVQKALHEDLDHLALFNRLDPTRSSNSHKFKFTIMLFLAKSLERLHSLHLTHRDIKPQNVMIVESGRPFFIDFGMIAYSESNSFSGLSGTPQFMAPEIRSHSYSNAVDVYSLGITFYLLLKNAPETLFYSTDAQRFSMFDFAGIEVMRPLLLQMTRANPQQRPSAAEVFEALKLIAQQKQPQESERLEPEFLISDMEFCENLARVNKKLALEAQKQGKEGSVTYYEERAPSGKTCTQLKQEIMDKIKLQTKKALEIKMGVTTDQEDHPKNSLAKKSSDGQKVSTSDTKKEVSLESTNTRFLLI